MKLFTAAFILLTSQTVFGMSPTHWRCPNVFTIKRPLLEVSNEKRTTIVSLLDQLEELGRQAPEKSQIVIHSYTSLWRQSLDLALADIHLPGSLDHVQYLYQNLVQAERQRPKGKSFWKTMEDIALDGRHRSVLSDDEPDEAKTRLAALKKLNPPQFIGQCLDSLRFYLDRNIEPSPVEMARLSFATLQALNFSNAHKAEQWRIPIERTLEDISIQGFSDPNRIQSSFHGADPQYLANLGALLPFAGTHLTTEDFSIPDFLETLALPTEIGGLTNQLITFDGALDGRSTPQNPVYSYEPPSMYLDHDLRDHWRSKVMSGYDNAFVYNDLGGISFSADPVHFLRGIVESQKLALRIRRHMQQVTPIEAESISAILFHIYHEIGFDRPRFLARPLANYLKSYADEILFEAKLDTPILERLDLENDFGGSLPNLKRANSSMRIFHLEKAIKYLKSLARSPRGHS